MPAELGIIVVGQMPPRVCNTVADRWEFWQPLRGLDALSRTQRGQPLIVVTCPVIQADTEGISGVTAGICLRTELGQAPQMQPVAQARCLAGQLGGASPRQQPRLHGASWHNEARRGLARGQPHWRFAATTAAAATTGQANRLKAELYAAAAQMAPACCDRRDVLGTGFLGSKNKSTNGAAPARRQRVVASVDWFFTGQSPVSQARF